MADNKRKTGPRSGSPKTRARSARAAGEPTAVLAVEAKSAMDSRSKGDERRSPPRARTSEPAKAGAKLARTPAARTATKQSNPAKTAPAPRAKAKAAAKTRAKTTNTKSVSRKAAASISESVRRKPRSTTKKAPAAAKPVKNTKQAVRSGTNKTQAKSRAKGRPNARRLPIQIAKFGIGEIVCHRFYPFRGVVFDIDPVFANTEDWWRSIPQELRPRKDQPFYHLLAENDETEYIAYVSEQNLVRDKTGAPVRHPQVPEMFVEDEEGRLLPVFRQEH